MKNQTLEQKTSSSEVFSDENIRAVRTRAYISQIKDGFEKKGYEMPEEKIIYFAESLADDKKLDSEYVEDMLKDEYNKKEIENYQITLEQILGVRFRFNNKLSSKAKFKRLLSDTPLSEQTLVKESLYFYEALNKKPVEKAYYPFSYTDRTGIYSQLKDVNEVVAVDCAGVGIEGSNVKKIISDVAKTQDKIDSDSIDLTIVTPGTPIGGNISEEKIDYEFRKELQRTMKNQGLLIVPKNISMNLGGDYKESKTNQLEQPITDYYAKLGKTIFETNDFSVICVLNKDRDL